MTSRSPLVLELFVEWWEAALFSRVETFAIFGCGICMVGRESQVLVCVGGLSVYFIIVRATIIVHYLNVQKCYSMSLFSLKCELHGCYGQWNLCGLASH